METQQIQQTDSWLPQSDYRTNSCFNCQTPSTTEEIEQTDLDELNEQQ